MAKCDIEERGLMSDVLFKWTLMKRNFNMQLMLLRLNYLKINLPLNMELWYEQEYFNPYNFFCNETTVKIKLGSLRLTKNTLVNNSENPDGVKKIIITVGKPSN